MFRKLLVANRGEIASRVMRTAHRLGLRTVAVYSDADRDALHVATADEARRLGPAPASQSYLDIERTIAAAVASGADAVHPGYGFLSENPAFVEACTAAGIVFVGPPAAAVRAMGLKDAAKRLMEAAGVPVVPGYHGETQDDATLLAHARRIGFPVLVKAVAGGGGKGMRRVDTEAEFGDALEGARREARASFGDDRVLVERCVTKPRHVEVQVFADAHGNAIHLFERDCSLQRRHQKVVEEAPAPGMTPAMRAAMGEAAVAAARAIDYRGAGTVEFIADASEGLREDRFWFMEMNTRLQVEHPVTEMVTGLDLVECMIRIAAGQPLGFGPEDVTLAGWAMESRVYAENPLRGFLPSTGRLVRYLPPPADDHVRLDTGVREGGEISMYYDPMIAKLITRGDTRDEAIHRMRDALDAYCIDGVDSNLAFLSAVFSHPRFVAGRPSTDFIEDEYPHGFGPDDVRLAHRSPHLTSFVVVAAAIEHRHRERAARIAGRMPGGEATVSEATVSDAWVVVMNGREHPCRVTGVEGGEAVEFGGGTHVVRSDWWFGQPLFRGTVNDEPKCFRVEPHGVGYRLAHRGMQAEAWVLTPRQAELWALMPERAAPDLSRFLLSPMPGLLVSLAVREGDRVKAGQDLAVIEAMKMENVLRAESDAMVKAVHVAPGDSLAVDQPILEFE